MHSLIKILVKKLVEIKKSDKLSDNQAQAYNIIDSDRK